MSKKTKQLISDFMWGACTGVGILIIGMLLLFGSPISEPCYKEGSCFKIGVK